MSNTLVIIPTYNEKENIELIIRAVFSQKKEFDILIVDDTSTDGTYQIVQKLLVEFSNRLFLEIRKEKTGLGAAYVHGFKWALCKEYQYIIEMDADFSHPVEKLESLYNACAKDDNDVSVGSRYIKGGKINNWDKKRLLLSYLASKYVRIITGIPVKDTTAGFVCYKRTVLEKIDLEKIKFLGYAFQIELKFKAWKNNFKIVEIPITFTDRIRGKSKMNGSIISEAIFGVLKMKFMKN
ncbi:MAG: dolichyl-phosphate beta-D-mannosyltransferase [Lutibacter sp.]|nr:MAG: dolichyl-phosphate beta-D-mannosyltransferase [Lutibacter sp.]